MFAVGGITVSLPTAFVLINTLFKVLDVGGPWWSAGMEAAADLAAAIAAVHAIAARFPTSTDEELVADVQAVEVLGRMVDGLRIGAAAEVEHRSRRTLGDQGLASRLGEKDGIALVQQLTGTSHRTACSRVGLGAVLAPRVGLDGSLLPGKHPVLADAISSGMVGIESARIIVDLARTVRRRAEPDDLAAAVESLTGLAQATDVDGVREAARAWELALDPDGTEPQDRARRRERAARLGATLKNGMTPLTLMLLPEHLAIVKELLQSRRRNIPLTRTPAGGDQSCDETDPEWRESENPDGGDPRPRTQHDYDILFDVLAAGLKAEHDGINSSAVTHDIVVTITAAELEQRRGAGWTTGVLAGLAVPTVERKACTEGVRLLVVGDRGEVLHFGQSRRLFTTAQKKALTVAARGRCQYPGCRTPAPYLEAHHAAWWHRDTGPTDVDNGIMLCTHHHHLVHEPDSPVEIRSTDGDLWIVPRGWRGPLHEHQRRQRGPSADPALDLLRRHHDPARNPFTA